MHGCLDKDTAALGNLCGCMIRVMMHVTHSEVLYVHGTLPVAATLHAPLALFLSGHHLPNRVSSFKTT